VVAIANGQLVAHATIAAKNADKAAVCGSEIPTLEDFTTSRLFMEPIDTLG